jgi:hypothetical protein
VKQGDRLDNIAAALIGDPQQFWRICDANYVLHPAECEDIGRTLTIAAPEGVPGSSLG